MVTAVKKLEERIQLRASAAEKRRLISACQLAGFRNLTSFIMNTMNNECKKVFKEHLNRTLTKKDAEIILNSIINPPKANQNLIALFKNK